MDRVRNAAARKAGDAPGRSTSRLEALRRAFSFAAGSYHTCRCDGFVTPVEKVHERLDLCRRCRYGRHER